MVVLEFSEALTASLSSATVIDPGGHHWPGEVTAAQEIRVPLETNLRGLYSVDWSSVSLLDGHHRTGSFAFGVRVSTAALAGARGGALGQPSPSDLLIGAVKRIEALAIVALSDSSSWLPSRDIPYRYANQPALYVWRHCYEFAGAPRPKWPPLGTRAGEEALEESLETRQCA